MQSKRTAGPVVRVLVVDDDEDTVHTIADFLRMHGLEVATATSGQQALHMAEQVRPQVAFVDLGMNDISGYIVAMRLRRTYWGAAMALAAVSGWSAPRDKQRALMAGFDVHLTKPARPHELLAFVTHRASRGTRQEARFF
jgi:DNA-binding response OmpR family regulator